MSPLLLFTATTLLMRSSSFTADAFHLSRTAPIVVTPEATCHRWLLHASTSNNDDDDTAAAALPENQNVDSSNTIDMKTSPRSHRRIGGRAVRRFLSNNNSNDNKEGRLRPKLWWSFLTVPIVATWLLFQNLFGAPNPPPYVYYQSSFYESRVTGIDGKVETSRKESVRTNIPRFLEENKDRGSRQQEKLLIAPRSSFAFDRALDREMQRMFDDFF